MYKTSWSIFTQKVSCCFLKRWLHYMNCYGTAAVSKTHSYKIKYWMLAAICVGQRIFI